MKVASPALGSDPPGADIDVDGSFVGNTPSDVQIAEGEHTVAVKMAGVQRLGTSKSVATHGNQSASLCSAGQPRRLSPLERFTDNAKWDDKKREHRSAPVIATEYKR